MAANLSAEAFKARFKAGKTLTQAQDDGFTSTPREDLVDRPMILQRWEIRDGIGGSKFARVWALVLNEESGEVEQVKFEDGGRSFTGIPATLAELTRNKVRGGVTVVMRGEPYTFTDDNGLEMDAVRYSFESPDTEDDSESTEETAKAKGRRKTETQNLPAEPPF